MASIEEYRPRATVEVYSALKLLLYTLLQPGTLLSSEWSWVDLEKAEWRIPAEKMRTKLEHLIPLSTQAVEILKKLQIVTGKRQFLFPGHSKKYPTISTRALEIAFNRMGYATGTINPSGVRHAAQLLLSEMGNSERWIEKQLGRLEPNPTSRAYNHAEYVSQRTLMLQGWADYLDQLRTQPFE